MLAIGQVVRATLVTLFLAACSPVTVPLGRAPDTCGEATEFTFIGEATFSVLGFDQLEEDPDFMRRGRFWVTAEAIDIPMPTGAPRRAPSRMLCVEWLDGRDIGTVSMSIRDDWVAP